MFKNTQLLQLKQITPDISCSRYVTAHHTQNKMRKTHQQQQQTNTANMQ